MTKSKSYLNHGFKTSLSYRLYIFFTAIAYPCIVYGFLPEFKDYQNYIIYVERAEVLIGKFAVLVLSGSPTAIFREPLWPAILYVGKLLFTPQIVIGIMVGLSLMMLSLGVSRVNKRPWISLLLILLLYPLSIMYFMQIRQGFAIAMYIWAYPLNNKKGWFLRLLTPFIHVSTFILIAVEMAYEICKYFKFSKRLLIAFSSLFTLIIVVFIPFLVSIIDATDLISEAFQLQPPDVSGLGVLLWSTYGSALFLLSRPSKELAMCITGILIFIFSQFYIDIGSRLLQAFLPFIITSFSYKSKKIQILIAITLVLGIVLWLPTIINPGRVLVN